MRGSAGFAKAAPGDDKAAAVALRMRGWKNRRNKVSGCVAGAHGARRATPGKLYTAQRADVSRSRWMVIPSGTQTGLAYTPTRKGRMEGGGSQPLNPRKMESELGSA